MKFAFPASAMRLTFLLITSALGVAPAWSQCNPPSSAGVVICNPTNNSTVAYGNLPPMISVRSTPAQGAKITALIIYDNNKNIYQNTTGGIDMDNGQTYNGEHHIVANVWDSEGHLYQAKTNFYVTGLGYPPCVPPSAPGVDICSPPPGGIYPTYTEVNIAATGKSAITTLRIYLNGKLIDTENNQSGIGLPVQLSGQDVANTVKVVATDSSGNKYSASATLKADYTYGLGFCDQTCVIGINPVAPNDEAYVGNTFNINMQVINNTNPITEMKAYLDNTVVATSTNAALQAEITGPNGTHILTVQAWDDKGLEYRIQQDVNINVKK